MQTQNAWSNSMFAGPKMAAARDFSPLTPDVQKHLQFVYATLSAAVASAGVGAAFYTVTGIGGMLGFLGVFGCLALLAMNPATPHNYYQRLGYLCGLAFFKGLSVGPLISAALAIDASIVTTAFLATSLIFGCLTLSATYSERRAYMFLGGFLSSAISIMFWLGIANIFMRIPGVFLIQLYGGLLVFAGYVLFDTQMIIEKANHGDRDVVGHATSLFIDFAAIFIRILIILMRNSGKKDDRRNNRR